MPALRFRGVGLGILLAAAAARAEPAMTNVVLDGVAAHVNGSAITVGDVMVAVEPARKQFGRNYGGDDLKVRLRKAYDDALNSLIERRLILDAYKAQDQKLPDWVVEQRVKEIVHDMFGDDQGKLMDALAEDGLTYGEWHRQMEDQVIVASMRHAHVNENVRISPLAVRERYDRNPEAYVEPEKIKLRVIQLDKGESKESAASTRRQAQDIVSRLAAGEDFAVLARTLSSGPGAEEGGDWGWVEPSILRSELLRPVESLAPGQAGEPVETDGEVYILKLEGRKARAIRPFGEVQSEIESAMRKEEGDRLYQAWVSRLKAKAYVKVFEADVF